MAPPASEAGCRPNLPSSGKFSLALRRLPPRGRIQLDQLAIRCEQGAERTLARFTARAAAGAAVRRRCAKGVALPRPGRGGILVRQHEMLLRAHAMLQRILRRARLPLGVFGPRDFAPFFRLASARALDTGTAAPRAAPTFDMAGFLAGGGWAGTWWAEKPGRTAQRSGSLTDLRNIVQSAPLRPALSGNVRGAVKPSSTLIL
jgi:hypothetical protein